MYASDDTAVVELLLLAHDPDADPLKRRAANMALEWFDPAAMIPARPSDEDEPEAVKLLRLAILSGHLPVRIAAGEELAARLRPASVWSGVR